MPLILFIDACRGNAKLSNDDNVDAYQSKSTANIKSNTYIHFGTVDNYQSFSNKQTGSIFTSALCKQFKFNLSLNKISKNINKCVKDELVERKELQLADQVPIFQDPLTYDITFIDPCCEPQVN